MPFLTGIIFRDPRTWLVVILFFSFLFYFCFLFFFSIKKVFRVNKIIRGTVKLRKDSCPSEDILFFSFSSKNSFEWIADRIIIRGGCQSPKRFMP